MDLKILKLMICGWLLVSSTPSLACQPLPNVPTEKTRSDFIREGLKSVRRLITNPTIPAVTQTVTILDNHQDTPNKALLTPMSLAQIRLPSGAVVGIQTIHAWTRWYKRVMGRMVQVMKLQDPQARQVPEEFRAYEDILNQAFPLFPEQLDSQESQKNIFANRKNLIRIEETLMSRWLQITGVVVPYPKQPPKSDDRVILVPILPGMAMTTSGIGSTFGWHVMLSRLQRVLNKQGKKIQIVPVSISYPFYGGPVDAKYFNLQELTHYVDRTIQDIIQDWVAQGVVRADQVDVVLMGRSMGGTLSIHMHNKNPDKYPAIIAGSPMLSAPHLHLIPAEKRMLMGDLERTDAADSAISVANLDINFLNLSAALIAQSFLEERLPNRNTQRVMVVWSDQDPEYPDWEQWQPVARTTFRAKGIEPIILPDSTAHNNLSERHVFETHPEILQPALIRVLTGD